MKPAFDKGFMMPSTENSKMLSSEIYFFLKPTPIVLGRKQSYTLDKSAV